MKLKLTKCFFVCLFASFFLLFRFVLLRSFFASNDFLEVLRIFGTTNIQLSVSLSYSSYENHLSQCHVADTIHLPLLKVQVGRVPYACDTAAYRVFSVSCQPSSGSICSFAHQVSIAHMPRVMMFWIFCSGTSRTYWPFTLIPRLDWDLNGFVW